MRIEDRWVDVHTCKWPKKNGEYILSLKSGEVVFAEFCNKTGIDDKPRWYELDVPNDNDFIWDDIYIPENEVEAWMPKPPAYKKGGR